MKIKIVHDSEYRFEFTPENEFDKMLLKLDIVSPSFYFHTGYLSESTNLKTLVNKYVGWDTYVQCKYMGIVQIPHSAEPLSMKNLSRWIEIYVGSEHTPTSFKPKKGYRPATSEESFIYILFFQFWLKEKVNEMYHPEFQTWVEKQLTGPDMSIGKGFPKLIHKVDEEHVERIELLKRIVFKAENLQRLGEIYFTNYKIKINPNLEDNHIIRYVFDVLEIPYQVIDENENGVWPITLAISFGAKVDLKLIYYVTSLLKEIWNREILIYIIYENEPKGIDEEIYCGYSISYRSHSNISKPITPDEILKLHNIAEMEWEEFSSIFQNINYDDSKTVSVVKNDVKGLNSENHDFVNSPSYSEYGGAYGYDDDAIDNAFDGDPENYWNVD